MKVKIRTKCSFCDGEAYLPVRETVSCSFERYTQPRRCADCIGSGEQEKWVGLREFEKVITGEALLSCPIALCSDHLNPT